MKLTDAEIKEKYGEFYLDLIDTITDRLKCNNPGQTKSETNNEILDINGIVKYTKLSKKTIYKLTSQNSIPFIKRNNKKKSTLLFRKKEIDKWLDTYKIPVLNEPKTT